MVSTGRGSSVGIELAFSPSILSPHKELLGGRRRSHAERFPFLLSAVVVTSGRADRSVRATRAGVCFGNIGTAHEQQVPLRLRRSGMTSLFLYIYI